MSFRLSHAREKRKREGSMGTTFEKVEMVPKLKDECFRFTLSSNHPNCVFLSFFFVHQHHSRFSQFFHRCEPHLLPPPQKIETLPSPYSFLSFYGSAPGLPSLRLELSRARSLDGQSPPSLTRARSAALTSPDARFARPFNIIHTL